MEGLLSTGPTPSSSLNMTHFDPNLFPNYYFSFFFILLKYLNYFQVQTFCQKSVFYFINLNATKYEFLQGGEGGLANFLFCSDKGGKGGRPISDFGSQRGEEGSGPPNFWLT